MRNVSVKRFLDQMKQSKMQWLQLPNQTNVHNLNNVRRQVGRHFRYKYLNARNDEFETMSKIKNIRDF
jgi:hypothetical protein